MVVRGVELGGELGEGGTIYGEVAVTGTAPVVCSVDKTHGHDEENLTVVRTEIESRDRNTFLPRFREAEETVEVTCKDKKVEREKAYPASLKGTGDAATKDSMAVEAAETSKQETKRHDPYNHIE